MGRTVPTFRTALESEIQSWVQSYGQALRRDDRKIFDKLMDFCRNHADAGSVSNRLVIFEIMVMNILLELQKQINVLNKKLEVITEKLEI